MAAFAGAIGLIVVVGIGAADSGGATVTLTSASASTHHSACDPVAVWFAVGLPLDPARVPGPSDPGESRLARP